MVKDQETRKGPWTEQEDLQLVISVRLFGERHWDFIAQVSGLNRTGKSCRLRWVNYLQPGLKRGRMSPDEERLVLELHSRWGNRWSRIARRLPGRTDNEIKNYWRTHMRKRAQERKRSSSSASASASASASSSSSSSLSTSPSPSLSSSSLLSEPPMTGPPIGSTPEPHGDGLAAGGGDDDGQAAVNIGYPMEQIWNEIESSEMSASASHGEYCCKVEEEYSPSAGAGGFSCVPMLSPPWDYSWDTLWKMDDDE